MNRIVTLATWLFAFLIGVASTALGEGTPLGIHFLRCKDSGGFVELEFRPDGNVISYSYRDQGKETEIAAKGFVNENPQPSFQVDFLAWKFDGEDLVISQGGKERSRSPIWEKDGRIFRAEAVYRRVEQLLFFDLLFKETDKKFKE